MRLRLGVQAADRRVELVEGELVHRLRELRADAERAFGELLARFWVKTSGLESA